MRQPQYYYNVYTIQGGIPKLEGVTAAVSEKQAINNVRCNTRGIYESQYKSGTQWVAHRKEPVTQEDAMQSMINMAEQETKRKASLFVDVDFDRLKDALKAKGNGFNHANEWLGHGNSYLSQRRKYGQLSLLDIEELEKRGFPRVLYVTAGDMPRPKPEEKTEEPVADPEEQAPVETEATAIEEEQCETPRGIFVEVGRVTELLAALIHMTPDQYVTMAMREFNDRIIGKIMEVIPEAKP